MNWPLPRVTVADVNGDLAPPPPWERESFMAGLRAEQRRQADREILNTLAAYCHTVVEAWLDESRLELVVRAGYSVSVVVTDEQRRRADTPNSLITRLAGELRQAWFAYTPTIEPHIILGES